MNGVRCANTRRVQALVSLQQMVLEYKLEQLRPPSLEMDDECTAAYAKFFDDGMRVIGDLWFKEFNQSKAGGSFSRHLSARFWWTLSTCRDEVNMGAVMRVPSLLHSVSVCCVKC